MAYYFWILLSLAISVAPTWILFPKSFGEFPLFGDISTLIFIPAYFILGSTIINISLWIIKNEKIKIIVLLLLFALLGVSSALLLRQNYSQFTSCFLSIIGATIGFTHFSITEALRRRKGNICVSRH